MTDRADLVQAVRRAGDGPGVARAVAALAAYDRDREDGARQGRELDLSARHVTAALTPVPLFERHTAATDWLGDEQAPPGDWRTAMIAEASTWYRSLDPAVRADAPELAEQAAGRSRVLASACGEHAPSARAEFLQVVGYLHAREGASGLPQIDQTVDPNNQPSATPYPTGVFDNFAPEQNDYNTGAETPDHQGWSSEQAPMIQQLNQQDSSGSGFGGGPELPDSHTTQMDTSHSYAEVPLGPPGQIPTGAPGQGPSVSSTPNPIAGQPQDAANPGQSGPQEQGPPQEGDDDEDQRRQASLRSAAYGRPDHQGYRWAGADEDGAFATPYHEKCASAHWPEQSCERPGAHTASVAIGYSMNREDFARIASAEATGARAGREALAAAGGSLPHLAERHNRFVAAWKGSPQQDEDCAVLHGFMATVRPVLAGGDSKCKDCGKATDRLDMFPGGVCRDCWAQSPEGQRMPTADEVVSAWGGPARRRKSTAGAGRSPNFSGARQGRSAPVGREAALQKGAAGGYDDEYGQQWESHVPPHMRDTFKELNKSDPDGWEHKEPADSDYRAFEDHVRSNYPEDVYKAYFHRHEGTRRQGASSLPQIQQVTDPNNAPDPQGDQLNPQTMFPIDPAFAQQWETGPQGAQPKGPAGVSPSATQKEGASRSMTPSSTAVRMFGRMDAMDGRRATHQKDYPFSNIAHGNYLRGWNETRGTTDGLLNRTPIGKDAYKTMTGRPDLHAHYMGHYSTAYNSIGNPGDDDDSGDDGDQGKTASNGNGHARMASLMLAPQWGPQQSAEVRRYMASLHTADKEIRTVKGDPVREGDAIRAHQPPGGILPPGDWRHGTAVRLPGDDDLVLHDPENGSHYNLRGYVIEHTGSRRTADTLTKPLQTTDDYAPPYNTAETTPPDAAGGDYQSGLSEGRADAEAGERPAFADNSSGVSPYVKGYAEGYSGARPQQFGTQPDVPRSAGGDSGQARNAEEAATAFQVSKASLQKSASVRVSAAFITREAVRDPEFVKGYRYARKWNQGTQLVSTGSAAFEAGLYAGITDNPGAQHGWVSEHRRLAARHGELADRLASHESFTRRFASLRDDVLVRGLYVQASRPPEEAVFRGSHLASPNASYFHGAHDFDSSTLCGRPLKGMSEGNVTRAMSECPSCAKAASSKTAGTSVDLVTDGPGTSPDPAGSTPINGPGTPPPMGGRTDPAKSAGPPPYQGAPPAPSGPVVPDDVMGEAQEQPQPQGPLPGFSGPDPGYGDGPDLAPGAPDAAAKPGYSNPGAYQGDPRGGDKVAAFRARVQAGLKAREGKQRVPFDRTAGIMTDLHGHAYSALKAQHRAWESGSLNGRADKRSLSLKELSEKLGPSKLSGKGPRDLEGVMSDLVGYGHAEKAPAAGEWQLARKKAPVIDMNSRERIGAATG